MTIPTLTPTSGGTLTDAGGNNWTLTAAGVVEENGRPVHAGSGTEAFTILNGLYYGQDANSGNWFTYSPVTDGWSDSPVPAPGPPSAFNPLLAAGPVNTGTLVDITGTANLSAGALTVSGTVLEENGTLLAGAGIWGAPFGALDLANATVDCGPLLDPNLAVGLMAASHLNLSVMPSFLSPVVLADKTATIGMSGLPSFAGITVDAKTNLVDFVSQSNVVMTSMRVLDIVPNTGLVASYDQATSTVTLGLFHN